MRPSAQRLAPRGTQYTELFFPFLCEVMRLWRKEINMLSERFASPAGHRKVPAGPPLSCLTCSHTSCACHLEFGPEYKRVAVFLGDGDTQLPMEKKYTESLGRSGPLQNHTF